MAGATLAPSLVLYIDVLVVNCRVEIRVAEQKQTLGTPFYSLFTHMTCAEAEEKKPGNDYPLMK